MTDTPEFSRTIDRRHLTARPVVIEASVEERKALAARFGLVAVHSLRAELSLVADGERVTATGPLTAGIVQSCAISGDDLPATIAEDLTLLFVPEQAITAEEIELEEAELDEISYTGTSFDLGEAVAQSLALAIDPYACGPDAERVRQEAGLNQPGAGGAFAALAQLRKN